MLEAISSQLGSSCHRRLQTLDIDAGRTTQKRAPGRGGVVIVSDGCSNRQVVRSCIRGPMRVSIAPEQCVG